MSWSGSGRASTSSSSRIPEGGGPAAARGPALVRALVPEDTQERQENNLHVEPHGPVLDVVEVVLDPLVERRVAAEPIHLRPAGDSRFDVVAEHVARDRGAEL